MRYDQRQILTIVTMLVLAALAASGQADDRTLEEMKCQQPGVHGKMTIREIQCQPNLQGFDSPTRLPLAAYLHGYRDAYLNWAGNLISMEIEGTSEAQRYENYEDVKYCMRFVTVDEIVSEAKDLNYTLDQWANNTITFCVIRRSTDRRNATD